MTFAQAVAALRTAEIPNPERDAQKLRELADLRGLAFDTLIKRRVAREPVSHIIGERAFWTSVFKVTSDVLDPRPDTETLVEAALRAEWRSVLDLGTGSGCILLSLLKERDGSTGVGVDLSEAALSVARDNAARLGLGGVARFVQSDWFAEVTGRFDLIVSNPPYITAAAFEALTPELRLHEPKLALTPGGDGLEAYRVIAQNAAAHLTPGGALVVEIGHDQADAVCALFAQAGFGGLRVFPDINGKDRVITAKLR